MSVRRCQSEVSSREFSEWIAFNKFSPIGEQQANHRSAVQCSITAASFGGGNKFKPSDFIIEYGDEKKQDIGLLEAQFDSYVKSLG